MCLRHVHCHPCDRKEFTTELVGTTLRGRAMCLTHRSSKSGARWQHSACQHATAEPSQPGAAQFTGRRRRSAARHDSRHDLRHPAAHGPPPTLHTALCPYSHGQAIRSAHLLDGVCRASQPLFPPSWQKEVSHAPHCTTSMPNRAIPLPLPLLAGEDPGSPLSQS